ncbi:DUF1702 family protein [Myceligenerans xiligouense]|uniref:Uncharacterized protein DUF1702 n=1 Tax=Myceligenerans xiligouense TaxID=253184 RepID=A0A3N4YJY1_9MICO|nr:DUF1702 family protein [Myceligenerans xiligouense]RPF19726.1 uncharacterized protein DUF1702 [Myceligenerans xiligouense]
METPADLPIPLRRLRATLTTPGVREVDPERRGFRPWEAGPSIVAPVGHAFLDGYRIAMTERGPAQAARRLDDLPRQWQGFAAEGAAMAITIRAALEPWSRHGFATFEAVTEGRHSYMAHVGLGWALARLPRPFWPDLTTLDPAVAPLVLDGYGFHEVFFHSTRTLERRGTGFPEHRWPGGAGAARQSLMQGIGRGLWFWAGGSPTGIADVVARFDRRFSGSLWAGTGLAAAYAGGRDRTALAELLTVAGDDRRWVRQGAAFAVEARHRAGTVNEHTPVASAALCGGPVADVVELVGSCRPRPADGAPDRTAYESWRRAVATALEAADDVVGA